MSLVGVLRMIYWVQAVIFSSGQQADLAVSDHYSRELVLLLLGHGDVLCCVVNGWPVL